MDRNLQDFFQRAQVELEKFGFENWDIYCTQEQARDISWRNKEIEDFKESSDSGYAIRILDKQKVSLVYANNFDLAKITKNIENAKFILDYMTPDENFKMHGKIAPPLTQEEVDLSFNEVALNKKIQSLAEFEELLFAQHPTIKKIEQIGYGEVKETSFYRTKYSPILEEETTHYGYSADVIAQDGEEEESGSDFSYKRKFRDLDIAALAEKVAYNAYSMLHSKPIRSGYYQVVLKNDIFAQFLSTFLDLFSADKVQNNKSVLAGKIGEQIASSSLYLVDDGTLPGQLGSMLFDGEGTPAQRTPLVKEGKLSGYLYDLKTASKDKVQATGNALRAGYQGSPAINPTNIIVGKGQSSYEDLISAKDQVLVINNVMGMHTSNLVNGDFSVGATGYLMNNGGLITPVKQITIAGNFLQLLSNISNIASDVESFPYHGNIITPSVLISELSVSGV